jgi:tetratricopeptide (TPR) repeat protein
VIAGVISGVVNLGRDNDARLLRLRTALELGMGFQLVLVEVEPGPIRKEVIRRIQTWSGRALIGPLSVVSLDPDATLPAQLDGKSGAIVTGLEPSGPTEVPVRDWIAELNWSRDALPALVSGPLILVVSQAIHQGLFERASDLYSWRRHTARVVVTARELAVPLSSPGDRYWVEERERLVELTAMGVLSPKGRTTMLVRLADVLLQLGDERGASRALEEASGLESSLSGDGFVEWLRPYRKLVEAGCALLRRDRGVARAILDSADDAARIDETEDVLALLRGRMYALEGAWDAASVELGRGIELTRAVEHTPRDPDVLAQTRECLCQVAFARGDLAAARREVKALLEVVSAHLREWGAGMLLRLAEVVVDMYPEEISLLLEYLEERARSLDLVRMTMEELEPVEGGLSREMLIRCQCLRARSWLLLGRIESAREELRQVKKWSHPDDAVEVRASLSFCEAAIALGSGSTSEEEVAVPLARACELLRPSAPRQAAIAGLLLGGFQRGRRPDLAVVAYQGAAADARMAGDLTMASDAELGELGAAVEGGIAQDDASDRLRAVAEQFRAAERDQSEGFARAALGRCLLHRGLREAAIIELDRARSCFIATTDAAHEAWVVQLVETAPP